MDSVYHTAQLFVSHVTETRWDEKIKHNVISNDYIIICYCVSDSHKKLEEY